MNPTRLNLAALRRRIESTPRPHDPDLLTAPAPAHMTRREWLGMAGVAAVGVSPLLRNLRSAYVGNCTIKETRGSISFFLQGQERWTIDTRWFTGHPQLHVYRSSGSVSIKLINALLPGTSVPADLECTITSHLVGSSEIRLHLSWLDFHASADFEPWLLGLEKLHADVHVEQTRRFGRDAQVCFHGDALATFTPDWRLCLEGNNLCQATVHGTSCSSNTVLISAFSPDDEGLIRNASSRHSRIRLSRGDASWGLLPPFEKRGIWQFRSDGDSFDALVFESAEDVHGSRRHAILAEQGMDGLPLIARMVAGKKQFPVEFPLRNQQLLLSMEGRSTSSAVIARFDRKPFWIHSDATGFEVGDAECAKPFELLAESGNVRHAVCSPALLRTCVPMPDAIVEPSPVSPGTLLAFAGTGMQEKKATVQMSQAGHPLANLPDVTASVIRPMDLVKIDFEFVNLKLNAGGGVWELTRKNESEPAYIIANFPPQNIAEQAFFEVDKKIPIPTTGAKLAPGQPVDPDAGKSGGDPLPPLPVGTRLSGPSRIAFVVPGTVKSISYTLKSLLQACSEYELSVSNAASVLTSAQRASMFHARPGEMTGVHVSAANAVRELRENIGTHAASPSPGARTIVQSGVKELRGRVQDLLARPEIARTDLSVQRRVLSLQNAVARHAETNPSLAALELHSLNELLQAPALSVSTVGAVSIAPPLFGQLIPVPAMPGAHQTALELPYRLFLSPHTLAGWAHAFEEVTHNERTELWHSRLAARVDGRLDESNRLLRTVRAVWSPDFKPDINARPGHPTQPDNSGSNPFRMSLDRQDRFELVHLSSNFSIPSFTPAPVEVDHLMLSTLGAWINSNGVWSPRPPLSVQNWHHRGTMGRDHFVRVVYAGYLFPFGHRASLIKITERKFQPDPKGRTTAYLRQRMYIVVREPEKTYPAEKQPIAGRDMPFRRIRVLTAATPNLDDPANGLANQGQSAFWPKVGGKEFLFHMRGEDSDGQRSEFSIPAVFVDQGVAFDQGLMNQGPISDYDTNDVRRTAPFHGQKIAFAESSTPGDTTFETDAIVFGVSSSYADVNYLKDRLLPPFYPTVSTARIRIKAVEQLAGGDSSSIISYAQQFKDSGLGGSQNKGEVWAVVKDAVQVNFSSDSRKSGGVLSPNMSITGLSRTLGTVGGSVDDMAAGKFDPGAFFKDILGDAVLFGCIPLSSIVNIVDDFTGALDRVPRILNEETPDYVITRYEWNPSLRDSLTSDPDSLLNGVFVPRDPDHGMTVSVLLHSPRTGQSPTYEVVSELKNFEVHLIPKLLEFMILKFTSLSFKVTSAAKVDISVVFDRMEFAGPLSFVNELQRYIPNDGFSDPPGIDVSPSGVRAGFSIGIPDIAIGIFSLSNISLSSAFEVPFDGRPVNTRFAFCERDNPFILTVSIYGGGGFFGITISPVGVLVMEASLEFGGALALSLGVASGGVYVMAGIYFKKAGDVTSLEGYFRCGGCLQVLGLISVSLEFYMGLTYQSNGKVFGQATLKVKVEVLFFSKTVSLTVERQFAGSAGDPRIAETIDGAQWEKYLSAFA